MRIPKLLVALLAVSHPCRAQDLAMRADSIMLAAERSGFSGVVRVEQKGQVVLDKGYGLANRASRIPFTAQTVIQIGSNTKDFTAVAILQLHQRGLLNLHDSIGRFFPAAPPDKRSITVAELMNHTAGFPLALGADFDPVSREQLVANAMQVALLFPPGTRENYSNPGYSLLAAIIEQVSGENYDSYVRNHILVPLGLTHTGFLLPNFSPGSVAHGYRADGSDNGTMISKPHWSDGPYWNLRGNGAMLSTVDDMHAFYKALYESDALLKPAIRDLRFHADEPVALAGSDGICYFVYERAPIAGVEIIVASTNAAQQAPPIRSALARLMGLQIEGDGRPVAAGSGGPPGPAAAALINEFVQVLNRGDTVALRRFITDHFSQNADSPPLEQRLQRLLGVHDRLGTFTVERMVDTGAGVDVEMTSPSQSGVVMSFQMEQGTPGRIRALGLRIGGVGAD